MQNNVRKVLNGDLEDNIFPFLWLHGEPEDVLRRYMAVIQAANCRAVCLESRPHPDFLGDGWWHDLDILLDEARQRGMRVWILDDSHFPTGYANGALEGAEPQLCRQFLTRMILESGDIPPVAPAWKPGRCEGALRFDRVFHDDRIVSVTKTEAGKSVVCYVTRNRGPHRHYINMLDAASCRVLIDTVYEAHYARYAADFGTTIAGFFSDEPELGNDHLYEYGKRLWELDDLPWSEQVEAELKARWGKRFEQNLPLLWEPEGPAGAKARFDYMDVVTNTVRHCFSEQIGDWCRDHGVEYIGHLIEDNNQHTRTGSSLGHYFRGLAGQDMAGIDDIGNQVLPQGEWNGHSGPWNDYRDGEFYHYVLGKLGASLASIDPKKKGHCLCEIFGNYGWEEGVKLEKYLADHFLVRGVNRFVPHAFSPKAFPDPDCPPHFYAGGHNPQFRHFGALVGYMSRLCTLLSGGRRIVSAAILYTAVAEWTGAYLDLQKLAIPLYDARIDYDFLPEDAVSHPEEFELPDYRLVLIPGVQYITRATEAGLRALRERGCRVWFVERYPEAACDSGEPIDCSDFPLVKLTELADKAADMLQDRVLLSPENKRIRVLHYRDGNDIYFLINEGTEAWHGTLKLPTRGPCCAYNAWDNRLEEASARNADGGTVIEAQIVPGKSLCLIFGLDYPTQQNPLRLNELKKQSWNGGWTRSQCESIRYPGFENAKAVDLPDRMAEEQPRFSGLVRYEKCLRLEKVPAHGVIEITDASEGVELFVNGKSLGIQIAAPFLYDLSGHLYPGENPIAIEVATTMERALCEHPQSLSGLHGQVNLFFS